MISGLGSWGRVGSWSSVDDSLVCLVILRELPPPKINVASTRGMTPVICLVSDFHMRAHIKEWVGATVGNFLKQNLTEGLLGFQAGVANCRDIES